MGPSYQNPLYFSHQTLESAFSSLNILPENSPATPFVPFSGEQLISQRRQVPSSSFNDGVSLQSLRFQEGQMGSGVGPRNQTLGPQGFSVNSAPVSSPAMLYGDRSLAGGSHQLDFLMSKKQSAPHYVDLGGVDDWLPQVRSSLSLNDIWGSIVTLAKDQHFSKILQKKFLDPSPQEVEMILSEILNSIDDLMKNQFGNNFVKKLIGSCNEDQRTMIILSVTKSVFQFISVCCNAHGTRGIQTLMEHVSSPHQVSLLVAAISPSAAILARDTNGHHVIQHCLNHFPNDYNLYILNNIASNCFEVATSKTGCCVMQLCVEKSFGRPRQVLVSEIIASAVHLAEHPFGNYVLQHLLGLKESDITGGIVRQLQGNFVSISCNKYGSNVVEKCMIESSGEQCTRIITELVRSPNASMMLLDPFGNFVIQSALSVTKGYARNVLLQLVRANAPVMRSNLYGRKILSWLEKRKLAR
ncbi:Pumilio isogenyy domain family member 4 [Heracleum sosnowskyi]|uniref:Pumilio isogenyy domain family member 4 n=1 Tax=Heracleum sosnowskyi TaxID=360622 RepID=A0AAD8JJK1_9APIA|nr:Pumilio isogenyy domain family member 4 [Heracleum sosnowskyi]